MVEILKEKVYNIHSVNLNILVKRECIDDRASNKICYGKYHSKLFSTYASYIFENATQKC